MRGSHRLLAATVATVVIGSATGCAMACTEAGYTNVLEVVVTGAHRSDVASMQLCTDERCVDGVRAASRDSWVFELFVDAPREPQVTAFDASGATLASARLTVDWHATVITRRRAAARRSR